MEKLDGIASEVVHGTDFGETGLSWHTTDFRLADREVCIATGVRSEINDGDLIAVAGKMGAKKFRALAYNNRTLKTEGDSGHVISLVSGYVLLLLAVVLIATGSPAALLPAIVGAFLLVHASRIKAAKDSVRCEAAGDTGDRSGGRRE